VWGYLRAAATRTAKVEDEAFKRFTRRELRLRLLGLTP
jgi:phosphoribulokinase